MGRPSFRVMAGRSRAISHTTLHEAVQGHRLPSWGTTAQFVQACGADPESFRESWEQANRIVGAAGAAYSAAPPAAGAADGAAHGFRFAVPVDGSTGARDGRRGAGPRATNGGRPPAGLGPSGGGTVPAVPLEPDEPDAAPRAAPADAAPPVAATPDAASPSADAALPADAVPGPGAPPDADGAVPAVSRRRRRYAVAGATAAVLLATGAGMAWPRGEDDPRTSPKRAAPYEAGDCPVKQQNPPVRPPAHEGDGAAFITDVTVPDCTHVRRGQTVVKVWRFKNTGVVPWSGYMLHRIDLPQTRDQCQTITDVPIADAPPGRVVDVAVTVTAPSAPAFCFVRFKLVDANGTVAFPGNRPVNFQVIVD